MKQNHSITQNYVHIYVHTLSIFFFLLSVYYLYQILKTKFEIFSIYNDTVLVHPVLPKTNTNI